MKNRIHWMDALRGLAMLIVILYHATNAVRMSIGDVHVIFTAFNNAIGPFRMPALFLLSGMLVERSLAKGTGRYVAGKLKHVAWPYLIWVFITELGRDGNIQLKDLLRDLGPFEPSLWFLWYLFAFYMLHLLLQRVHPAVLAFVAMGVSMVIPDVFDLPRLSYMYAFFALGVLVGRHLEWFDRLVRSSLTPLALLLPVAYVAWVSMSQGGVRYQPLMAPWVLGGIVLLVCLCAFGERWAWFSRPLEFVGRHSIVFYLVQWPLILFLARLDITQEIHRTFILVPAIFMITVLFATVVSLVGDRSRIVNAFFVFPELRRRAS